MGRLSAARTALLVIFFSLGLNESARATRQNNEAFPQLLSYAEIMSLTTDQRAAYLDGVRALLVDVAKVSQSREIELFVNGTSERGRVQALEFLFPMARASVGGTSTATEPEKAEAPKVDKVEPAKVETAAKPSVASEADKRQRIWGAKCQAPDLACTPELVEKYRTDFYAKDKENLCIYAGNVSEYSDRTNRRKRCRPVSSFSFAPKNPGDPTAQKPAYKCEKAGEVICNPLVFGVDKTRDNSPFCVSRGGSATAACDKLSTPEKRTSDFLSQDIQGLPDAWNEFRGRFNKVCRGEEAALKFHCSECQVIASRLVELNAAVRGSCEPIEGAALKSRGDGAIPKTNSTSATK